MIYRFKDNHFNKFVIKLNGFKSIIYPTYINGDNQPQRCYIDYYRQRGFIFQKQFGDKLTWNFCLIFLYFRFNVCVFQMLSKEKY